jgi:hypothetical protein
VCFPPSSPRVGARYESHALISPGQVRPTVAVANPVRSPPQPVGLSDLALFDRRPKSSAIRLDLHLRVLVAIAPLCLPPLWLRPMVRSEIRLGPEGYTVWLRPRPVPTLWKTGRSPRSAQPKVDRESRGLIGDWLRASSYRPRFSSRPTRRWRRPRALHLPSKGWLHQCTAHRSSSRSLGDPRVPERHRHDPDLRPRPTGHRRVVAAGVTKPAESSSRRPPPTSARRPTRKELLGARKHGQAAKGPRAAPVHRGSPGQGRRRVASRYEAMLNIAWPGSAHLRGGQPRPVTASARQVGRSGALRPLSESSAIWLDLHLRVLATSAPLCLTP